jgi:hypothetical protein
MRDEKYFEFKYQHVDVLAALDPVFVMKAFYYVFIQAFAKKYAHTGKTEYQLMFQHRRIF